VREKANRKERERERERERRAGESGAEREPTKGRRVGRISS
jgi:hypothetical protein